ncbi:MAG: fibronectin type III domain-containing protein [Bacteroidales bacterium]
MKRLLCFLIVTLFAIQGWSQTYLNDNSCVTIPYFNGFENANENLKWQSLSSGINKWAVGTAAGNGSSVPGTNSYYISNDNGLSYDMSPDNNLTYSYLDIDFGTTVSSFSLKFDIKCQGLQSGFGEYDIESGLMVFLRDTSESINLLDMPPNAMNNLGLFLNLSNWETFEISLDSISGVKRLIFLYYNENVNCPPFAAIDNVSIVSQTSLRPFDLIASNLSTSSAELSFLPSDADSYIISYRPKVFGSTFNHQAVLSSPSTIQNLTLGTQYLIKIKAIYGVDTSLYSDPLLFTTLCYDNAITDFPWFEGFENGLNCWQQEYVIGTNDWIMDPTDNIAHSGTGYACFTHWEDTVFKTKFISPVFDISSLNQPYISFWHWQRTTGNTQNKLRVYYRSNSLDQWTELAEYINNIDSYFIDSLHLVNHSSTYQIAFEAEQDYNRDTRDIMIDDIIIYDASPNIICSPPANIIVVPTKTTANVSVVSVGLESSWEYVYGESTAIANPNDGNPILITNNSFQLTGLTPQTLYSLWVRSICSNDSSQWSDLYSFSTDAQPASIPYNCGFENANENLKWQSLSSGINKWAVGTAAGNGASALGTHSFYISNDNGLSYDMSLDNNFTYSYRDIDFGTTVSSFSLKFDVKCQGLQSGFDEYDIESGLIVFLRDTSESINLLDLPPDPMSNLGLFINLSNWETFEIPIDSVSGVKRLIFFYYNENVYCPPFAAIDNVSIVSQTSLRPFDLIASNLSTSSAELSFLPSDADSYIISYRPNISVSSFNHQAVLNSPSTIQNLTLGTQYLIKIKAIYGVDTSLYSDPLLFTTLCYDDAITDFPWFEGFENGLNCWQQEYVIGTNDWIMDPADNFAHSGTGYACFTHWEDTVFKTKFISLVLDISALNQPYISFWHWQRTMGNTPNKLRVFYRSNSLDQWTELAEYTNNINSYFIDSLHLVNPSSTYQIAFEGEQNDRHARDIIIDDILIYDANPNNICFPPANIIVIPTKTTANVSVVSGGLESSWEYVYGESTTITNPDDGNPIQITNNSFQLTGLTPQTLYSLWVRSICSNDSSQWSDLYLFSTDAQPASIPYNCGFEDAMENLAWGSLANGINKWSKGSDAGNGNSNIGINSNYISNNNGLNYGISNTITYAYTYRDIDFGTDTASYSLAFDWKCDGFMSNNYINSYLVVYLRDPSEPINPLGLPSNDSDNVGLFIMSSNFMQHQSDIINVSGVKRLIFLYYNDGLYGFNPAAIDNVSININTCPRPYDLLSNNVSSTSADISWSHPGADSYIVSYSANALNSIIYNETTSNTSYTIQNLSPGTPYSVIVKAICNGDSTSLSNMLFFKTLCSDIGISNFPWTESFEAGSNCWQQEYVYGQLNWTENSQYNMSHSGQGFVNFFHDDNTGNKTKLISPILNISGLNQPYVSFWHMQQGYQVYQDKLKVFYRSSPLDTWIEIANYTTSINSYRLDSLLLPNPSSTYQIAFEGEQNYAYGIAIDDISFYDVNPSNSCFPPTNIEVIATKTTADITLMSISGESSWEYVYGESNTFINPENALPILTNSNIFQLIGLNPQTQYNIWVRSLCDNASVSDWSNLFSFVTEASPASIPYSHGFENTIENLAWKSLSNGINKWAIGTSSGNGLSSSGTNANYISNDNGLSYGMSDGYIYAYTYRDIDFGTDTASYRLTFDWKCQGHSENNYVQSSLIVYLRDTSEAINTSGLPTNSSNHLGLSYFASDWQTKHVSIDNVSGVKRLIFFYFDNGYNDNPPAAIDNISINYSACPRPSDVLASNISTISADISWSHPGADSYIVSYWTNAPNSLFISELTYNSSLTIHNLLPITSYIIAVRAICNGDTSMSSQSIVFTTLLMPPTVTTNPATLIEQTIATLNGSIGLGSENVITQGFEWKLSSATVWTAVITPITNDNITYTLTGLTANTDYQFRAYATTESATTYGITQDFTTLAIVSPIVITNSATSITQILATLNGTITEGSETITSQGFEWKIAGSITWTAITTTLINNNSIIHNLIGLIPDTTYCFRAYAITPSGTIYGIPQPFTTLPIVHPTVITSPATLIEQTIATLNGTITEGSEDVTSQGFEWKLVNATVWTAVTSTIANDFITYNLTGLTANTDYQFRAYATTESATTYGITQDFTTLPIVPPTVTSNPATLIEQTIATLNGTITEGSEDVTTQGFEWKLVNATVWTAVITPITNDVITYTLTGLTANTDYQFRAYATTLSATTYGITQDFTTLPIVPPTVTTSPATLIEQTIATLHGTITEDSENITSQGFEWKLASATTWTSVTSTIANDVITYNLTGLTANTDYQFRAYATTELATTYGITQDFTTLEIVSPTVTSNPATLIEQTIATLNGTITEGSEDVISQGFEWKLESATVWTAVTSTITNDALIHNLTSLTANTDYQFRAYATTLSATTYGLTQDFTTLPIVPPTVTTNPATLIEQTIATLHGTITEGSEDITSQGFEYKEGVVDEWLQVIATLTNNTITYNLTDLISNTSYKFRSYATTESGTTYGNIETFTTLDLNGVTENVISIMMYPNPATNQTKLIISGISGEAKIELSDVQGKILNTINAKSVSGVIEKTIDIKNLAKGVYYIRIENPLINRTEKLIVN